MCGSRSANRMCRTSSTCSPDCRAAARRWSPPCCWPAPTTRVSTSLSRSRATAHGVRQADVLGEDDRLVSVLRIRLADLGVSPVDHELGVLVVAIGSSNSAVNARTAQVASKLAAGTRWAGATMAFATRPEPSVAEAANRLRRRGARRLVIAPWFLAPGRITDRVCTDARDNGIPMAPPLGAHRLVAETVLDRYDQALANHAAA